jgi:hypothetical protein
MQMFDVSFVQASASGTIGVLVRLSDTIGALARLGWEHHFAQIGDFNPDAWDDPKRHRHRKR